MKIQEFFNLKVEKGKQRYIIGFILDNYDNNLDLDYFYENGYRSIFINKIDNAVIADFPCRTDFSILLAVWLVYPKIKQFIKVNLNYFSFFYKAHYSCLYRPIIKKSELF